MVLQGTLPPCHGTQRFGVLVWSVVLHDPVLHNGPCVGFHVERRGLGDIPGVPSKNPRPKNTHP